MVNDKHGNPITGLLQKDLSLIDNGQSQQIRVFNSETSRPSVFSHTPLPPDTYTNRPEEQTSIPASVTVILPDELNTESGDQALAGKQVIDLLAKFSPKNMSPSIGLAMACKSCTTSPPTPQPSPSLGGLLRVCGL